MLCLISGLRRGRSCWSARGGFGSIEVSVLGTIHDFRELPFGLRVQLGGFGICSGGHRLAQAEGGTHYGARHGRGVVDALLCHILAMLLAVQVVVVGIFAVVRLLAGLAGLLEGSSRGGGGSRSLVREHLLGEYFR